LRNFAAEHAWPPLTLLDLAQLSILSLASVSMHTSAALGHSGSIPGPCLVLAYCTLTVSKSLL
jgi:hypothetical protein